MIFEFLKKRKENNLLKEREAIETIDGFRLQCNQTHRVSGIHRGHEWRLILAWTTDRVTLAEVPATILNFNQSNDTVGFWRDPDEFEVYKRQMAANRKAASEARARRVPESEIANCTPYPAAGSTATAAYLFNLSDIWALIDKHEKLALEQKLPVSIIPVWKSLGLGYNPALRVDWRLR